jgi:hypothetical protein
MLEPGDLATQDLLRHEHPRRGAPEVKLLGHGDEVAQAAQFDDLETNTWPVSIGRQRVLDLDLQDADDDGIGQSHLFR